MLPDGNLLVSARNTWTVYKLDRRTGAVILATRRQAQPFPPRRTGACGSTWQATTRDSVGTNRITLFDDGFDGRAKTETQSRAIAIDLDFNRHTAKLAHSYLHPKASLSLVVDGERPDAAQRRRAGGVGV